MTSDPVPSTYSGVLSETRRRELVCYLVDSTRNACYCIFVTFAGSQVPFCVMCTLSLVFSIASLWGRRPGAGGQEIVTPGGFVTCELGVVSIGETKTRRQNQTSPPELPLETKAIENIQFLPKSFFCFDPEFFLFICKIRLSNEIY